MNDAGAALAVEAVVKRYGDRTALDGVSLAVAPGEVVGLLGPNGAGKTTLVSCIAGLRLPDTGSIRVGGGNPGRDPAARARLGICPQELALYDDLTADQNLEFFGGLYGLAATAIRTRRDVVLERVGLTDRRSDRVKEYSGGMKRRLNLAVAMLHEPVALLLDEPTVGVDPQSRALLFDEVERLRDEGRAVLYTTHYMEEAERLCDRIVVIDHGRIMATGTLDEILGGGTARMTVTLKEGADAPTAEQLRSAGLPVTSIVVERRNLETVFLELTGRSLRDEA